MSLLIVGALVGGAALFTRRGVAETAASRVTAPPPAPVALDLFAHDGAVTGVPLDRAVIAPIDPPVIVRSAFAGLTPLERDQAFANRMAAKARLDADKAAAAKGVLDARLAEEDAALAAMRERESRDAREAAARPASPTPQRAVRTRFARRSCGCNARAMSYEFTL